MTSCVRSQAVLRLTKSVQATVLVPVLIDPSLRLLGQRLVGIWDKTIAFRHDRNGEYATYAALQSDSHE